MRKRLNYITPVLAAGAAVVAIAAAPMAGLHVPAQPASIANAPIAVTHHIVPAAYGGGRLHGGGWGGGGQGGGWGGGPGWRGFGGWDGVHGWGGGCVRGGQCGFGGWDGVHGFGGF